jgi:hypothetical protein
MTFENAFKKIHAIFQRQAQNGNLADQEIDDFNRAQKVIIDYYNEKEGIRKKKGKNNIPPSPEEVEEYCRKRANGIDPKAFINYYESKGWYIGSTKMKDWQAAIRTWENRRKNSGNGKDRGKNADKLNDFD